MELKQFQFESMFKRGCFNLIDNKCNAKMECSKENCIKFKRLKEVWDKNGFIPSYINK